VKKIADTAARKHHRIALSNTLRITSLETKLNLLT